jgi:Tol biopolymer transport system component
MRKRIAFAAFAAAIAALIAIPAAAMRPGSNGRIVFARYDPALDDDFIYTANPDGSHEQAALATGAEGPRWSPDGTRIVVDPHDVEGVAARIANPDDGSYRDLLNPDPDLFVLHCAYGPWSPDGRRLTCEAFGNADQAVNGIYTIRSSDGSGLERITADPGGEDCPGDYSPNGKRLVFLRSSETVFGLFTVKLDGTGLRQISPPSTDEFFVNFDCGSWSPQGNEILFSAHVPNDHRATIWAVHSDGSGLRKIPIQRCGGLIADPDSVGCFNPNWSPDGTKILFDRLQPQLGRDIYTVNADGTGLSPAVTNPLDDESPDWGTHPVTR